MILKKSIMTLYSGSTDLSSHIVRMVLAEKGIGVDIRYTDNNKTHHEDLLVINPYSSIPTLVDRELVLYRANIINEYLDERFPHPPLLPVYPITRSKCRLIIYRIERDLLSLLPIIQSGKKAEADKAKKSIYDQLVSLVPVFAEMPYFLSEDFSLADCCLAPMLWRLPHLGIKLPQSAKAIFDYKERIFSRESFKKSLSELEIELR